MSFPVQSHALGKGIGIGAGIGHIVDDGVRYSYRSFVDMYPDRKRIIGARRGGKIVNEALIDEVKS
jgi:hypothetical protein